MMILGIDPGTARIGWGIISTTKKDPTIIACGLITTEKTETLESRLKTIFTDINEVITTYPPDAISIEDLFFATNAKTAIRVGEARGVLMLAASLKHIPVYSYAPLSVKRTICGDGNADKKQMQYMVTHTLKLVKSPEPDDVADALALALTHAFCYNMKTRTS